MPADNTTLFSGYDFDFLTNSTQLVGSHFHDPVLVAAIVINGTCAFGFAALLYVAGSMRRKSKAGVLMFAFVYGLMGSMFIGFLRSTIDGIAHEYEPQVPNAYIALVILKQLLANTNDCLLLYAVYDVISNRLSYIQNANAERISWTHFIVALLVFLLGLVDSIIYVYVQVFAATHSPDNANAVDLSNWYRDIHVSFSGAYCAVTLEMLVCAYWIFSQSGVKITQSSVASYLLVMVTPFLAIRAAANLAFAVIYTYLGQEQEASNGAVSALLVGLTAVVLYSGLVFMGFCDDWSRRDAPVLYSDAPQDIYSYGSSTVSQQYGSLGKSPLVSAMKVR